MKKKLFVILALVVMLSLVLAVTSLACDEPADCSPGFWKNHTSIWQSWAGDDYDWMLAALKAKGWEPNFADRWVVTDMLNDAFPGANCD